jgi:hypothetical protein
MAKESLARDRLGTLCASGASQARQYICHHPSAALRRKVLSADKKQMHAEHADGDGLNDLSGAMIGCAFTSACGWISACAPGDQTYGPRLVKRSGPSACSACICSLICAKFLSCPAARQGRRSRSASARATSRRSRPGRIRAARMPCASCRACGRFEWRLLCLRRGRTWSRQPCLPCHRSSRG